MGLFAVADDIVLVSAELLTGFRREKFNASQQARACPKIEYTTIFKHDIDDWWTKNEIHSQQCRLFVMAMNTDIKCAQSCDACQISTEWFFPIRCQPQATNHLLIRSENFTSVRRWACASGMYIVTHHSLNITAPLSLTSMLHLSEYVMQKSVRVCVYLPI